MIGKARHRLAAIIAADVVGYSRLIAADEAGTLDSMRAHRSELWDPKTEAHGGRLVGTAGDSRLVEFPSAVAAVDCAVAIQLAMVARNADTPEDRRIRLRIGINLGDVAVDGDDIHGDGVNIAARLEAVAAPDGICMSDDVARQVRGRLDLELRDGGARELKNIAGRVKTWHWSADAPVGIAKTALSLPDKPSIAVLPFENMSGDAEQEYFVDGITEDIITALSRLRWLFVIARNSTFTYKGKAVDVKQVGREMGVRYVLEGSVRRSGLRIRVTAQLIKAESGNHIWANRYDRDLTDVFDLQDELTEAISANVDSELAGSERALAHNKGPADLDAWDLYQRGMWHYYKAAREDIHRATELFQHAVERSPEFASAYSGLAHAAYASVSTGFAMHPDATLARALRDAELAVALDDRDSHCHVALGLVSLLTGDHERAISALKTAIELNPNSAEAYHRLGTAQFWSGNAQAARPLFDQAIRLSPRDAALFSFYLMRSGVGYALGDYEQAASDAKIATRQTNANFWTQLNVAVASNALGRTADARNALDAAMTMNPGLCASELRKMLTSMHPAYVENFLRGLLELGLPDA